MKKIVLSLSVALGLSLFGDAVPLNRIPGVDSVHIPEGLTNEQALNAVEHSASGMGSWILGRWSRDARDASNHWVRVVLNVRSHSLTVCYRIENGMLVPDVPYSSNLNQNGAKIDGHVPGWINRFNRRIKDNLMRPPTSLVTSEAQLAASAPQPAATSAEQPVVAAPASPAASVPAAPTRFCEGCGKKVAADANFCGSCGRKLK